MKREWLFVWFLVCVLISPIRAYAEDIDLFVGSPSASNEAPNLLLVIDSGANFSAKVAFPVCEGEEGLLGSYANSAAGMLKCAVYKVVKSLKPGSVNVGVMTFNATQICDKGSEGGCLARDMAFMDEAGKIALLKWIKSWGDTVEIKTNVNKNGAVMQEAWAKFAGRVGLSGVDYSRSPVPSTCGKNFVVFIGNADKAPSDGGSASPKGALEGSITGGALDLLKNASPPSSSLQRTIITGLVPVSCGADTSYFLSADRHENRGFYADEWSRYMKSQGITTYSVGLLLENCAPSYEALISSVAEQGGGKFLGAKNFQELLDKLGAVFSEIQNRNSAFASVSLPVSVSAQGSYLNQVFIGMFRPEKAPRWHGNLKQYKLGWVDSSLSLLDADSEPAISSADTGFIAGCARSFWTPAASLSANRLYWADLQDANCGNHSAKSETPDGNVVEKGGQGYKLRALSPTSRVVKTCDGSCVKKTLTDFNSDNLAITSEALGVSGDNRADLINWARGLNVDGEAIHQSSELDPLIPTSEAKLLMRPSVHGDVVHSRPVAVDFGTAGNPNVVVFYGANDGMLRAINGNRDGGEEIDGRGPGEELWAFVAPESYGIFARLRANADFVKFPNVTVGSPKSYGFDGPVTAHRTATETWIYASMRRGGRMIYAFDVSIPQSPKLKWRFGCPAQTNDDGCVKAAGADQSPSESDIGQTWATPTVINAAGYMADGQIQPMLIMGGGYDRCEDNDSSACLDGAKGRAIFLFDANNGTLVKSFRTEGGVVGDITVVKNAQGLAMYAYAADLGGNVYRISGGANSPIGTLAPQDWNITTIARLGGTGVDRRKFMFGPDVVVDSGTYYILLGSGDREKPILEYKNASAVNNYFFMIKDQPTNATWLSSEREVCNSPAVLEKRDFICLASLYAVASDDAPSQASIDAKKGWYLKLDAREKVVTSALTIFGTVYFSTHRPIDSSLNQACAPDLGEARAYAIRFSNAAPSSGIKRYEDLAGDGLPPSPVAGLVTLDDGKTVPFCIGCNPESPLESKEPPMPEIATQPRSRVFWNIER